MNARLPQILILLGALVAFVPVLAVDYMLDRYIRAHETTDLSKIARQITNDAQMAVYDGISAVREVVNDSPSLCTPTFVANAKSQLQLRLNLLQLLVENADGVQYCDGYGGTVRYSVLSAPISIPGHNETISVVHLEGQPIPSFKVTQQLGANRMVSAFVHPGSRLVNGLPGELADAHMLRVALTNGTEVITIGDARNVETLAMDQEFIFANSVAEALPLITEVAVPFAKVRAGYADLDVIITVVAAMMSAAFLLLAFRYVREARLSGFDLERAISQKEFKPYYQPVMDLQTGQLAGCEVLIRWEKRDGSIVSPGLFIEYAEASGLAIPMTIQLMEQVREDLSPLCEKLPDLKIGINLFEGHFRNTDVVEDVEAIFGDSPIGFRQLMFEITERRPLEDKVVADAVIGGLQALGCRLAMDDVGTGHSNLAYIQTLGVDVIKIDKVFVDMIGTMEGNVPILDGLITMAKELGTEIIAEGLETPEQAVYLRDRGVRFAQGFLFAPALVKDRYLELALALNGALIVEQEAEEKPETKAEAKPEAETKADDKAAA